MGRGAPPAQLAKKVSEGVLGKRVTKRQAPLITNIGHRGYGATLGAGYGVAAARLGRWRTERSEVALGLSSHLVYGVGAAAVFDALD